MFNSAGIHLSTVLTTTFFLFGGVVTADKAEAQSAAFKQAVAEAALDDKDIAAFYRENNFEPIWTDRSSADRQRRDAFIQAVSSAHLHGLPAGRYDPELLQTNVRSVRNDRDLGRLEVEMSRLFVRYARDIQSGVIVPASVDRDIKRKAPLRDRTAILRNLVSSTPRAYIRNLAPQTPEYARLMKAKIQFEDLVARDAWGSPVRTSRTIRPGDTGEDVIELRNRLIRMGYMERTAASSYDEGFVQAVMGFQEKHGLHADGVVGPGTLGEINQSLETRLGQIIVAMERERWINRPEGLGDRHIWVNLTDFSTQVVDDGKVTFQTRSVVGERKIDKRTPEFSDEMEYMELNPDWTVPRSILGRDYLPLMQEDRFAAQYLELIDDEGELVSREDIDFTEYTAENFPFKVRQPPGDLNALGLVKFMFPNPHAIYLHDTPAKNLFSRELRAYSSGCVRLHDPFDLAYILLEPQVSQPQPFFDRLLASGQQTRVDLEQHVPVHIVYRTAFTTARGEVRFRRDFYERDIKIFDALQNAGVELSAVRS